MNDPYKVLNIPASATDDEVKHAYRELARKYHPDNYHDNPLADLAQEKMKEINEAYEQILKQRKNASSAAGKTYSAYTYADFGGGTYSDYTYTDFSSEPTLQNVRAAINRGDVTLAERLLGETRERGAEWYFLTGVVYSRRGWMDEARRCLETACRMEPGNAEYRGALAALDDDGYRPVGYRTHRTMNYGGNDCARLCAAWSCCMLSGGRCIIC